MHKLFIEICQCASIIIRRTTYNKVMIENEDKNEDYQEEILDEMYRKTNFRKREYAGPPRMRS